MSVQLLTTHCLARTQRVYVHPVASGLNCFLTNSPMAAFVMSNPETVDGEVAASSAVRAFHDALVVSAHRFGWPPVDDVKRAVANRFVKESENV